jgi:hypothetical protein
LDVELPFVGPVLKLLHRTPGVSNIHLDLDETVKKPRRVLTKEVNGEGPTYPRVKKDPNTPTSKTIIINELVSGPKNVAHLRAVLKSHNLSPSNVSSILYDLEGKKITKRSGTGLHQLTDEFIEEWRMKHPPETPSLPAPEAPAKAARGASRPFILQCISEGITARAEMNAAGAKLGISERMIDGALTRLKGEKVIVAKKDAPGVYTLAPAKVKPKQ